MLTRIKALLTKARESHSGPLVPIRYHLTPPGSELVRFSGHEDALVSATALDDGRRMLTASRDGTARLWDLETGSELQRFNGHEGSVNSATALGDGRRMLTASHDGTARLWDLETGSELQRFSGHEGWVTSATALGDGRRMLTASHDGTARLWDLETGSELQIISFDFGVTACAVSSDYAVFGDTDGGVHIFKINDKV